LLLLPFLDLIGTTPFVPPLEVASPPLLNTISGSRAPSISDTHHPSLLTYHRYCMRECRTCIISQYMGKTVLPDVNTGIGKHNCSYLFIRYSVAMTHALEKQYLIIYTYVRKKIYLSFLKYLGNTCCSAQQRSAFFLQNRRRMD